MMSAKNLVQLMTSRKSYQCMSNEPKTTFYPHQMGVFMHNMNNTIQYIENGAC